MIGVSKVIDRIIAKARSQEWLSREQKKHSLLSNRDDFLHSLSLRIKMSHFSIRFNLVYKTIKIAPKAESFSFEMCEEFTRELEQVRAFCEEVESYWKDLEIFLDDEYIRVCDEVLSAASQTSSLSNL